MASPNFTRFQQLHAQPDPLLLPNAWDARSAALYEAGGYQAIGTSSAAIASMLGYADGEQMPFDELLFVVKRICSATALPLTVDLEGGYSRRIATICAHLARLHELGVVGINIEDSVVAGARRLVDAAGFARTLEQLKTFCLKQGIALFINARTDTYLLGGEACLARTQERLGIYQAAGADGFFIPCLTDLAQMQELCGSTALPVNVMCLPGLPALPALARAGVKRVSMGNFLYEFLSRQQALVGAAIRQQGHFTALFQ